MDDKTKQRIREIKEKLRVTKVVCTRSVKGARGDNFVGWSCAWDTLQNDGTQDLEDVGESGVPTQAMSFADARIATCLLGMQVDVQAHRNAKSNGNLSPAQADQLIDGIRKNYARQLIDLLGEEENGINGKSGS